MRAEVQGSEMRQTARRPSQKLHITRSASLRNRVPSSTVYGIPEANHASFIPDASLQWVSASDSPQLKRSF